MAGSSNHEHDTCLVLDYGSQYTQLIARRIREKGVYSMLLPGDAEMVGISLEEGAPRLFRDGGEMQRRFPLVVSAARSRVLSSSALRGQRARH